MAGTWLDISPNISKGFLGVSFPSLNVGYVVGSAGTVVKTVTGGTITSTNNIAFANDFGVFPNPTNGLITIQSNNPALTFKVKVFESSGKLFFETNECTSNSIVDLSNVQSDIYFIEIIADDKRVVKPVLKY